LFLCKSEADIALRALVSAAILARLQKKANAPPYKKIRIIA
jgi:hypothetical protein